MNKFITAFITYVFFLQLQSAANDTDKILHDSCINSLYEPAKIYFKDTQITPIRDSRGIILRFELPNPVSEYKNISENTLSNIKKINYFLAKIKNLVIIEVHVGNFSKEDITELKKWEISTVIANNIESELLNSNYGFDITRIDSVGYGEFLPAKNTSNDGGKYQNRVDIIVLCNIIGE